MAVSAVIQNGSLVETASQASINSTSSTSGSYSKDDFLQLLVAQMKYQDPLEPTDNTEYITQYATFSQVEQMQNMSASLNLSRASAMVGKIVQVSVEDESGNAKTLEGTVDFVTYENNKAFVSIEGNLYSADSVTAIIDGEYSVAMELADAFANSMNRLPKLEELSLSDAENIETLRSGYNSLSSYQQSFIDKSYVELLEKYVAKLNELQKAQEKTEEKNENEEAELKDSEEGTIE